MSDPGERGMLTGSTPAELGDRLTWTLSRVAGRSGRSAPSARCGGERFAAVPDLFHGLQDAIRSRGLLYVDPRPGAPPPVRSYGRSVDLLVDEPATRGEIERRLAELERLARERGAALGLAADPSPVLVDRIVAWAAGLEERGSSSRRSPRSSAAATTCRGDGGPRRGGRPGATCDGGRVGSGGTRRRIGFRRGGGGGPLPVLPSGWSRRLGSSAPALRDGRASGGALRSARRLR
jgi:hypothetical protein